MPGRPELLIMCGLSFSGKTTLAREISERYHCPVISLDAMNAHGRLNSGEGALDSEWRKAHASALEGLDGLMQKKTPMIIIDDNSCLRFLRDNYRYVANRYGYKVHTVLLDTPMDMIHARRREGLEYRDRVSDAVFEEHCRGFQWPEAEEKPLTFRHGSDPEVWMHEHFLNPCVEASVA